MRVAVYGATGSTGRMVTSELELGGAEYVIGGRDSASLKALALDRPGVVDTRTASPKDQPALQSLLDGCVVVINCAPAAATGESLIRAALDAGTHYVDAAGEQPFVRTVFERFGEEAERRGVALIPALGFDYAVGDCIARLAADGHEPLRELVIAYALAGTGVGRDALAAEGGGSFGSEVVYADGGWRPAPRGVQRVTFNFPGPIGRQLMQRYGSGEVITVPRHTRTARVTTLITASSWAPVPALIGLMPYLRPLAAGLRRSPLRGLLRFASQPGGGAAREERDRESARFVIAALARGADGSIGRGLVEGVDFYGLTAASLALGAQLLSEDGAVGTRSAAAAFDPARFLDLLGERWLNWRVE